MRTASVKTLNRQDHSSADRSTQYVTLRRHYDYARTKPVGCQPVSMHTQHPPLCILKRRTLQTVHTQGANNASERHVRVNMRPGRPRVRFASVSQDKSALTCVQFSPDGISASLHTTVHEDVRTKCTSEPADSKGKTASGPLSKAKRAHRGVVKIGTSLLCVIADRHSTQETS